MRLVVQLIIRLVVNYQLQADNPADNQAVSFVVQEVEARVFSSSRRSWEDSNCRIAIGARASIRRTPASTESVKNSKCHRATRERRHMSGQARNGR